MKGFQIKSARFFLKIQNKISFIEILSICDRFTLAT